MLLECIVETGGIRRRLLVKGPTRALPVLLYWVLKTTCLWKGEGGGEGRRCSPSEPWGQLCVRAPGPHLSVTWFCGGRGVHSASVRSSIIEVSLGSIRLNSLIKTMKCV